MFQSGWGTGTTMRIIVTGGNSGIGKATAGALAAAGHSVVVACRDIPKAERAAAEMAGDVEVRHLDLADLTSVRRFADSVESVDVLVNNAGVMGQTLPRTADGFEAHMGINYLGCRLWHREPQVAARSTIAAVTTDLPSGTYIAPRFLRLVGAPKITKPAKNARDAVMARRLWELSAELTGCDWTVHPVARTAH
jgi:NAD(P)-dependent dehydrogenase (short-subunit alcohol dehydrogenase family)